MLLLSCVCWSGVFNSNRVGYGKEKEDRAIAAERLIAAARKDLGLREEGCGNCGRGVEERLKYVGFGKGAPWCAAAVSYWFHLAGYNQPRTAWSPSMFPKDRVVESVGKKGLVLGIYFPSLKRIAHVGLVEELRGDFITSIEANTNAAGSRNGDGVYRKIRHKRTIYKYADWL